VQASAGDPASVEVTSVEVTSVVVPSVELPSVELPSVELPSVEVTFTSAGGAMGRSAPTSVVASRGGTIVASSGPASTSAQTQTSKVRSARQRCAPARPFGQTQPTLRPGVQSVDEGAAPLHAPSSSASRAERVLRRDMLRSTWWCPNGGDPRLRGYSPKLAVPVEHRG
jgi:hypothetical protein